MKKYILSIMLSFCFSIVFSQTTPLWMRYPAISPNGKTIAFTYKNNIYTVSADGGKATAVTNNGMTDYKPVWSPNGKYIAYSSNRYGSYDIFIVAKEGGAPKRLTYHSGNEAPSSFSPDGKKILFSGQIQDMASNIAFPRSYLSELYYVPAFGGRIKQILSTPAVEAKYSKDSKKIIYQESKGVENYWRKHHTSSTTCDLRIYDGTTGKHKKLTTFKGEDRMPTFSADESEIYYISEQFGSNFNVCKFPVSNPSSVTQITKFTTHPVRFLTISDKNTLCFGYDGEIYVKKSGEEAKKVNISIYTDLFENEYEFKSVSSGITEMSVSRDGKEVAFIVRGNVFVSSVDYSTTKQITSTPEQERSVSFSPDGKAVLYASERNGSWNIYQTKKLNDKEANFANSTLLKEEAIVKNQEETFQPTYSPDGKEVAFLSERTTIKVINLKTKQMRTVLDGKYNYSYSDGDQSYQWSPDSKYILASYSPYMIFSNEIALIKADGKSKPVNLTQSGYGDGSPRWSLKGEAMIWRSDRNGYRSHGSWGAYRDIYAMFFTEKAFNKFNLSKEEAELLKNKEKEAKKDEKTKEKDKKEEVKPIKIEFDALEDRVLRLTINSSSISDAILSPDGEKLYYLTKFEKGYDLWVKKIRENETKLAVKLKGYGKSLQIDKKGENLFLISGSKIIKIKTSDFSKKTISFKAEYYLDKAKEREYMFEHIWRQIYKKFYKKEMHGVDWAMYKKEYKKFLSHINNNFDFTEMLSEMLGELNASHTGARRKGGLKDRDKTASLGIFYDFNYSNKGLKIMEVVDKSPLSKAKTDVKPDDIIEKIDGKAIEAGKDYFQLLNHKAGKHVLLSFYRPSNKKRWQETIKALSIGDFNNLLYERWVKKQRELTEKLSNGRLGYVHIRGMNSSSFRKVYSDLLGKNMDKDAVIIDSRYNHGGWLHDDLATLFSGKKYVDYVPRGQNFGYDPMSKWIKPSILLVCEGNYSDAHAFPYAYQTLKMGKIVGMPVPGTMTAVWWETQIDKSVVFGIPQVGCMSADGNYLENTQLEPEYKVENEYDIIIKNRDQQLEKAVEVMLQDLGKE